MDIAYFADMDPKDKEIFELKKLVKSLRKQNEYLKSPMYMWEITELIQGEYSILLNPPLKDFKTTITQKSTFFKIDINDIVCVVSDGASKWIYFSKAQISVDGVRHVSDKLSFTGSLENFCNKYDNTKIHLCIVSKSVAVNPFHYYLDKNQLMLVGKVNPRESCNNIAIGPSFIKAFIERKSNIEKIISFQKIRFDSK
jgi:hypothetical protein